MRGNVSRHFVTTVLDVVHVLEADAMWPRRKADPSAHVACLDRSEEGHWEVEKFRGTTGTSHSIKQAQNGKFGGTQKLLWLLDGARLGKASLR